MMTECSLYGLTAFQIFYMCVFMWLPVHKTLYVGPSAASNARTMFIGGGVNNCSLTHPIISLCLDLLPHSLEIQPALSTDTERESQSSIFSALCLPCSMFLALFHHCTHTVGRKLFLQMLPILH